jgi:anti-sigma factor RsiW
MACTELENTQAWFDGELDREGASLAESHAKTCAECTELLRGLELIRSGIRANAPYHRADAALKVRVANALDRVSDDPDAIVLRPGRRHFWTGAASGLALSAMAAALTIFLMLPGDVDELVSDVANAHMRSLVGTHLTDVADTDPNRLETWLTTHAGLAPPVADLHDKGFRLIGARADFIYGTSAAVAVYKRDNHVVNLFAWVAQEDETLPQSASKNGYNIVFWKKGNVVYCAASNIALKDLLDFERLQETTA